MTIQQGVYRGWRITIGIVPQTSGQMYVSFEYMINDDKLQDSFRDHVKDEDIREFFNLPKVNEESNASGFGYCRENANGKDTPHHYFQWTFMHTALPMRTSMFSFLAYLFKGTDKLADQISKCAHIVKPESITQVSNAPEEPTTPPESEVVAPVP